MNHSDLHLVLLAPQVGDAPIPPSVITNAVQAPVHLAVTVTISVLVGILFTAVYVQLIMVICFGYKLISYQTILLFNILLWAFLRLTLYSFYFYHCCERVNSLPPGLKWLLVSFPAALQYVSLAVLVHYFGEVCLAKLTRPFLSVKGVACKTVPVFSMGYWKQSYCNMERVCLIRIRHLATRVTRGYFQKLVH